MSFKTMCYRSIGALAASAVIMAACLGNAGARELVLYSGESLSAANIQVYDWGSGSISESNEPGMVGSRSIELESSSLYNGGFIEFGRPVEIADPAAVSVYDYLVLWMKFETLTPLGIEDPGMNLTATREYRPVPMNTWGGYYMEEIPQVPKVRKVRVVLYAADGREAAFTTKVMAKQIDEEGWFAVALPLQRFGITAESGGFQLARMAVGADYQDTMRIGELRVQTDDSPVYVDLLDDQDVGPFDLIMMKGTAEAGVTSLDYEWDFNASDGVQRDAAGQFVQVLYRKAGEYTVTLTVRDSAGIKAPATTTATIYVN